MGFRFPLAVVLLVRENAEKREERALQKLMGEMAQVKRAIDEMGDAIARADAAREQVLRETIPAAEMQEMLRQAKVAEDRRLELRGSLRTLDERRKAQLAVYQAAHRDHEAILSMFHEQRQAYEQEQLRMEQKSLDDLFAARSRMR